MCEGNSEWSKKGATLSDKSARKEYGLTREEIIAVIGEGQLQYRLQNMYGNPYFRLLRREVETLVEAKHGNDYLRQKQLEKELSHVNRDIKRLKTQVESLEQGKRELLEMLGT